MAPKNAHVFLRVFVLGLFLCSGACVGSPTADDDVRLQSLRHHQHAAAKEHDNNAGHRHAREGKVSDHRYKVMSYDAQNDHLNVIDDQRPSGNLRYLNKQPYYSKASHLLGHRGEHWTAEDKLRVKHQHAKMLHKERMLNERKMNDNNHRNNPFEARDPVKFDEHRTKQDDEEYRRHLEHTHRQHRRGNFRTKEDRHYGKILPVNPEMDRQWKEGHLQRLGDLKVPVRKEHDVEPHYQEHDPDVMGAGQHSVSDVKPGHQQQQHMNNQHEINKPYFHHPEPMKALSKADLNRKHLEALEMKDPFNKRFHHKNNKQHFGSFHAEKKHNYFKHHNNKENKHRHF